jgi:uncharacterized delta-60 repeat protein
LVKGIKICTLNIEGCKMKCFKVIYFIALCSLASYFLLPASAFAQVDTAWVRRYDGSNNWDLAYAIAVDNSGNVYVAGESEGSGTDRDYATIKYNSAGVQQWVARYNGPANDYDAASAIAVDNFGNVYVTGESYAGSGLEDDYDYLTVKYNFAGMQQWVARYNGPGNYQDEAYAIAIDNSGNVYVTGRSDSSGNDVDYATIKYNSVGVQQWVARYNGPGNSDDGAYAIAVDNSGNVYVTGYSYSGSYSDYATIKYNSNGVQQWVKRYNGPGNSDNRAYAIAVDNSGNVYVTGYSWGSGTVTDYATIKYNSLGDTLWVRRYNGPGNSYDEASDIAVDGSGNVYVTGGSFGPGTFYDYATIKYNANGAQQWVARYNGSGNNDDGTRAIAVDSESNVYVTGYSYGSGTDGDYATIKYNSNGVQQWTVRYNGPGNSQDGASAMALDSAGNIYITGESYGSGTGSDYATIKYVQTGAVAEERSTPDVSRFTLNAEPNPFSSYTAIRYSLPSECNVSLSIYDISGKLVKTLINETMNAGVYTMSWNGTDNDGRKVGQGIYFYVLKTAGEKMQKKMLMLR